MISINGLNTQLRSASARWVARQTPQFLLTELERVNLLGVVVDEAALSAAVAPNAEVSAPNFAPEVDWRNRNGNHVTKVKDQKSCGSCVSFCTVATVESMASIEHGQQLDLSEADLHFCSAHGANCGGWWPGNAYNVLKTRGVPDDACFPYASAFDGSGKPSCKTSPDRDARAVKITESTTLVSAVDRKNWLTNVGPCCAVMYVFNDFFAYGGGVYHHVSGELAGLHCVEVIGYSEAEKCWICKNSWGTEWGDGGFFKIAYGEAGIDNEFVTNNSLKDKFPFWTARGVVLPASARYAAIWEKSSGPAWQARHGMTSAQYQSTFDQLGTQGYRLVQVSGYSVGGQAQYAAIWEKSSGPAWQARHGMTSAQYQSTFDQLGAQGYRLVQVSGYSVGGKAQYAAIWEKSSGPAWQARHGMTSAQYQSTFDQLGAQGYRLVQVSGYSYGL